MFDYDADGYISEEEMYRYFSSFFGVVLALSKELRDRFKNLTAKQIAQATAKQCMKDADLNHDGHISFEEFTRWYRKVGLSV
jgi:Ca2+-binding EF-hand superfamily protein